MKRFVSSIYKVTLTFHVISGLTLAFMMLVTFFDVIMRNIGHPLVGGIEIISFGGSVVIGFAIPYASLKKTHVYVDLVIEKVGPATQKAIKACTRCMGIALFLFIGYNFIGYGQDLLRTGEVSAGFRMPYYPIAFGLAFSSFLQAVTLFYDLLVTVKGENNE